LPVSRIGSSWNVSKTPQDLARIAGISSALGDSSRNLWLKLPYCDNFALVARATTLPILLLGGESAGGPAAFLTELDTAMRAGHNVRGALVGRNILYPGDQDPLAVAGAAGGIVHRGWSLEEALHSIDGNRRRGNDTLSRYF
jgi:DhnA family fructose-bisphosphate aldolase class Ia